MEYLYKQADTSHELYQILELQKENIESAISPEEVKQEGFVTINHNLALLEKMNVPYGHVIAKLEDKVIGYCLVMLKELEQEIRALQPLVYRINEINYAGVDLKNSKFFIMGQVCVAKDFRGKGVFAGLYTHMQKVMSANFTYIITSIASRNHRSLRAHEKVGFEVIDRFVDELDDWVVVIWDISK